MIDSSTTRGSARSRYTPQLEQCRQLVSAFVDAHLAELFQRAGTALLDFAERAESNAVQGRFFEAIGQLQRRRPDIEQIFHEEINTGFLKFGSPQRSSPEDGPDSSSIDGVELSLLEPDEMEESVASENLVSKANASFFPELYALSQRLAVIVGGRKLKDSEIPGSPHHLVQAFRRAMDGLDVEVKVKVILYALLDKFVIRQCRDVYNQYNDILKAAGILPNLKPAYIRPDGQQGKAGDASATGASDATGQDAETQAEEAESADLGNELFDSIIALMATRRPPGRRGAGRGDGARDRPMPTPERAAAATGRLVSALSQNQARQAVAGARPERAAGSATLTMGAGAMAAGNLAGAPGAGAGGGVGYPNVQIDAAFLDRVKVALSQDREQLLEQVDPDDLSQVDADLIDLIGMLFEYMLNDPVLPNSAKALLSHLHTPFLKIAIIDRRLLVDSRHPARRLLDEMVEAGSLWVDETSPTRGIFPIMQQTVDRVLQEFTDDVKLFEELLESFKLALEEQQRRADTMEHRTQEAARGREKLQLSKQRAAHQVQILIGRRAIPPAVANFLNTTWTDRLVFTLLREKDGEEAPAWREAVNLAEQLVGVFEPRLSEADRAKRIAQVPRLRTDILREVERMGSYSRNTVDALRAVLDNPGTWGAMELPSSAEAQAPMKGGATVETMPASLPQVDTDLESTLSGPQKEMIDRLRKLRYGTWFELTAEKDGASRRVKLSWMSTLTSTCMFVDRAGMQSEVKTLREMADELLSGRAKVIPKPKHPFIDRALVSIRKMLQGGGKPQVSS